MTTIVSAILSQSSSALFLFFPFCYRHRISDNIHTGTMAKRTSRSLKTTTATLATFSTYGTPEASAMLATLRQALSADMVVGGRTWAVEHDAEAGVKLAVLWCQCIVL